MKNFFNGTVLEPNAEISYDRKEFKSYKQEPVKHLLNENQSVVPNNKHDELFVYTVKTFAFAVFVFFFLYLFAF